MFASILNAVRASTKLSISGTTRTYTPMRGLISVRNVELLSRLIATYGIMLRSIRTLSTLPFNSRSFQCQICDKCFRRNTSLNLHMSAVHPTKKLFRCEVCSERFSTNTLLKSHASKHRDTCNNAKTKTVNLSGKTVKQSSKIAGNIKDKERVDLKVQDDVDHQFFIMKNSISSMSEYNCQISKGVTDEIFSFISNSYIKLTDLYTDTLLFLQKFNRVSNYVYSITSYQGNNLNGIGNS
jgi:hypothetical protein